MTLKQQKNNLLSKGVPIITLAIMGIVVTPAFAAVSFPPWSTMQEIPSYDAAQCTSSSKKCANAQSSAQNDLIAKSEQFVWNYAYARNNFQKSPNVLGSTPELTTSASSVKYKGDFSWNGYHTAASPQYVMLEFGVDIYKKNGANWDRVTGCYDYRSSSGAQSSSQQNVCTITNSGSNTYRVGGELRAVAPAYLIGPENVADYWTGSYHADTTRLEVCTGC